jgi:lauroyl/myristoyl acyltransferase
MHPIDRPDPPAMPPHGHGAQRDAPVPKRWTLHGLNNGVIFSLTRHGVAFLPRRISYLLGHIGTWIAWRSMAECRRAIADNLSALFPDATADALEQRALETFRSYARDCVDFIRALSASPRDARALFEIAEPYRELFSGLLARKRGVILVTGHYGNWEVGSVLLRSLDFSLTIVAMAEEDPTVNRLRREIREQLGADTIEVRQSFDTALQIRRRLSENHVVAMLVDRHYGRDRVAVQMFGRHVWFLRTPMLMAHITGAPLLPCCVERIAPGRFAIHPSAPVYVSTDVPRDQAIADAAQQVADGLAARIRLHPEYWYHFYRYWDAQRDEYTGLA